ncbi:hypothetical protein EYF80_020848 [Liparis tanakae]|uniref:Uncharacterized protein n=1 Tax=Liparis tanakae TaxID=230148 RepID=A0A4Z2HTI3_9TELE|nr:hypothetical protein EYF80_020848 [Liparis tanakae]
MGRRAVEVRTAESREKERAEAAAGRLTGRQVKTQHLSLVKEKIHMAEEAGAISHAPAVSRPTRPYLHNGTSFPSLRGGVNTSSRLSVPLAAKLRPHSHGHLDAQKSRPHRDRPGRTERMRSDNSVSGRIRRSLAAEGQVLKVTTSTHSRGNKTAVNVAVRDTRAQWNLTNDIRSTGRRRRQLPLGSTRALFFRGPCGVSPLLVPSPGPGAAKQKHPIRLGNDAGMKAGQVVHNNFPDTGESVEDEQVAVHIFENSAFRNPFIPAANRNGNA